MADRATIEDLYASIKGKYSSWMAPIRVSDLRYLLDEVEELRAALKRGRAQVGAVYYLLDSHPEGSSCTPGIDPLFRRSEILQALQGGGAS